MKIAYFAEQFPSVSETWIHHEISQLIDMGCDVRVFATRPRPVHVPPELEKYAEITTYLTEIDKSVVAALRMFLKSSIIRNVLSRVITECPRLRQKAQVLRDIAFTGYFLKSLETSGPQIMVAHFGGTRANLALTYSVLSNLPLCIKFHAFDVFDRVALLKLKVERTAKLLTISNFNIEYMREHYPDIDVSRFEVHRCGIPVDEYPFRPKENMASRPVIISVGRLVPMKGFHVLLRASARLLETGFSHTLMIFGDGPERGRLEQQIRDLRLEGTVELRGYASPNVIRAALLDSDIFVLPAVFDPVEKMDGIPVALMEAMAIGIPVISTRISGIPELIESGVSGLLSTSDDPGSLSKAIVDLHGMQESDRRQMLLMARKKIEDDYNAQKLSVELMQKLSDCVRMPE